MPRVSRKCPAGLPVHIIQRGNNYQVCFAAAADRKELNPVRAGMVTDPADYSWSSYRAHALGCHAKMWCPHDEYLALGTSKLTRSNAYQALFRNELDQELISEIRQAANVGLALGNDKFKAEVERLTGRRQRHLKRGPKPKPKPHPKDELLL